MADRKDQNKTRGIALPAEQSGLDHPGKSWFFGIGINDYVHFTKLKNARRDVVSLLELINERYELEESLTLLDQEATRDAIINQLHRFQEEVKREDKLIIFYSGHGHLDKKERGYWLPIDAEPEKTSTFIRSSTIIELIEDIDCKHVLLISDSCFSGALLTRDAGFSQRALEELERDKSRWVMASGRQREVVADGKAGENSPFTKSILKVLKDNQAPGLNANLLFDRVTKLTRFNYSQMPQSAPLFGAGHEGGQYVFHLKADEGLDWKRCQELETSAAYLAFIDRYPNSIHLQEAQNRVGALQEEEMWQSIQAKPSIQAYLAYDRKYPDGKYSEEALAQIRSLEEEKSWKETKRQDTIFAYRQFNRKYPDSQYRTVANDRMQAILGSTNPDEAILESVPNDPPKSLATTRIEVNAPKKKKKVKPEETEVGNKINYPQLLFVSFLTALVWTIGDIVKFAMGWPRYMFFIVGFTAGAWLAYVVKLIHKPISNYHQFGFGLVWCIAYVIFAFLVSSELTLFRYMLLFSFLGVIGSTFLLQLRLNWQYLLTWTVIGVFGVLAVDVIYWYELNGVTLYFYAAWFSMIFLVFGVLFWFIMKNRQTN